MNTAFGHAAERPGSRPALLLLLSTTTFLLTAATNADTRDTCSEFFTVLSPGAPGSCAGISFFGFNGSEVGNFNIAKSGNALAAIDLFEEIQDRPWFLDPIEPVYASVETQSPGNSAIPGFRVEHRGRASMFPLDVAPPPGSTSSRFIAVSSRNRTIFQAYHPDPGDQDIEIDIRLEQDFELVDPIASGTGSDVGSSFRIETTNLETGEVIYELLGASGFDSGSGPEPNFGDTFRPGYRGHASSLLLGSGRIRCEFDRTSSFTVREGREIRIESLVTGSIFSNGFNQGNTSPWIADSGDAFRITINSRNPGVTFDLKTRPDDPLAIPALEIAPVSSNRVRLIWQGVNTQSYTVISAPNLTLPYDQWEEREAVPGITGMITREFPTTGTKEFFAVRTSWP